MHYEMTCPLDWPAGWPRTASPQRSKFGVKRTGVDGGPAYGLASVALGAGRSELLEELRRLRATDVVISTNMAVRRDGEAFSNRADPRDTGVAVYFRLKGEPRVLACDRWNRVACNMVALAKHIEAIRGQARWGVGSLEQALGGYRALPAMPAARPWWEVLGVESHAPTVLIEQRRIELLRQHHPDVNGAGAGIAAEINAAYDEFRRERGIG